MSNQMIPRRYAGNLTWCHEPLFVDYQESHAVLVGFLVVLYADNPLLKRKDNLTSRAFIIKEYL
jgi:hypothetical protein